MKDMSQTKQWVWADLSDCCPVPVTAAQEVSLAAAEEAREPSCSAALRETMAHLELVPPCKELNSLQPHSQLSRRPVQNLGAKPHYLLLFPRQAKEEIILPQVIRELWIKMEIPSSSTLSSASLWVSAVLALPLHSSSVNRVLGVTCISYIF